MTTNAMARREDAETAVERSSAPEKKMPLVADLERSFCNALPAHVTKEQFSRALQTSFRKTPRLMECKANTIAEAVLTAAQLGLIIGVNGSCWLIPFKKNGVYNCELVIGYQGMVDLCYRSDMIESIFADVVCENDTFVFRQGLDQRLDHTPNLRGERGEPYAVYATGSVKGSNRPMFVVLNKDEVYKIRNSSAAVKAGVSSPWKGEFETEMWKKTAIKRLCKLLPKSVELVQALEFDNDESERWADAEIVNGDALAQGRNSLPPRAPARELPEPEPPADKPAGASSFLTAADKKRRDEAWAIINRAFDTDPNQVDSMLADEGLPSFLDLDRDTFDMKFIKSMEAIAKLLSAKKG